DEEFAVLADVMTEHGIEGAAAQTVLQRAWIRRGRREPRKGEAWRVLFDEGRLAEAEEELRRRRASGLRPDHEGACPRQRRRGAACVKRASGVLRFWWRCDTSR